MRVVIDQKELDKAVQTVIRATAVKPFLSALSGILITAAERRLSLAANNYDIAIEHGVELDAERIIQPGAALVPGKLFGDLIKRIPAGNVTLALNVDTNTLTVSSAGASYNILTMKVEEFPGIDRVAAETKMTMTAAELRDIYKHTAFAVDDEKSGKPMFTGIHLLLKNGQCSAFATDSHRLAIKRFRRESDATEANIIIPVKALADVAAIFDPADLVDLAVSTGKIAFSTPETHFTARLITGRSPDFERIIPRDAFTAAVVKREQMLTSLERLALVSSHKEKNYLANDILVAVQAGRISIRGSSQEKVQAHEEVAADVTGPDIQATFNGTNIIECLKALTADRIAIHIVAPNKPAMLVPENDASFVYVFTPVLRAAATEAG
ncbi:MAG: DNA polymerase III subunit beta [Sporomusaceae bacterium]|nr:DNA polymerase III subunit beta [Sporomusaceae bacterium]